MVWQSVDIARALSDHMIHRLGGEENHTEHHFAIVSGWADRAIDEKAVWEAPNLYQINKTLAAARVDAHVRDGRLVIAEANGQKRPTGDPSLGTATPLRALCVITAATDNEGHDEFDARHFASIQLALTVMRQEQAIAQVETRLRGLRRRYDTDADELVWAGLRTGDALTELANIGSAISTLRAELWTEVVAGWEAGQEQLQRWQSNLGLPSRLANVERVSDSWASALTLDQALRGQKQEHDDAQRRQFLEQIAAGITTAAFVFGVAAVFVEAGKDTVVSTAWAVAAICLGLVMFAGTRAVHRSGRRDERAPAHPATASEPVVPGTARADRSMSARRNRHARARGKQRSQPRETGIRS